MVNSIKYMLLLISFAIFGVFPSIAGETDWFETDGGNVRVLTEPYLPGASSIRGVIDIDLQPGWKTYWRDPGSGGIPPSIQVEDIARVNSIEIRFPMPVWINSKYGAYAGYDEPVQIPFILQTKNPMTDDDIAARVFIGICKDICIPAFADFDLPIAEATGSSKSGIAVAAAFDALPKKPDQFNISVSTDRLEGQKLAIKIDNAGPDLLLLVSGRNGEQFERPVLVKSHGDSAIFHVEPTDLFDDGQTVELMLTGQTDRATFETSTPVVFGAAEK